MPEVRSLALTVCAAATLTVCAAFPLPLLLFAVLCFAAIRFMLFIFPLALLLVVLVVLLLFLVFLVLVLAPLAALLLIRVLPLLAGSALVVCSLLSEVSMVRPLPREREPFRRSMAGTELGCV